ncbi:hypothetical protein BELL_0002g00170 [Botrytis elliptica]|uniref:Uncharacterized protein n=1 Tax=Botrytis elliptica TaxID=278938 RepID=A0A4Z1K476_9HELO|nr:hypothetical protein BELL_0002g00170 [Botrytis elliptica]
MSNQSGNNPPVATVVQDDDEPDECTGCAENGKMSTESTAEENSKMTDCYFEKKDWRLCKAEV